MYQHRSLSKWVPDTVSLAVKPPGSEDDSRPSTAGARNTYIYTFTPPYLNGGELN
jgi:hypothetical protein